VNQKPLGTLSAVELREYWPDEAKNFTPWLEHNIGLLGEALGLDLEVVERERSVGPFSADLVCKNTADGTLLLVENQLEKTDHSHLGQILTYAGGLDAMSVVWVARRFTEEHRAAVDWLNRATRDDYSFFGVEIELWRIGESHPAPRFNLVSMPNDWSKIVKSVSVGDSLTDTGRAQVAFWEAFRTHLQDRGSALKAGKAQPQSWLNLSVGRSGFVLSAIASRFDVESNAWEGVLRAELVLERDSDRHYFRQLQAQKEEIHSEVDEPLVWHDPPDTKSCKVYFKTTADVTDESSWSKQHDWLRSHLERLDTVFRKRIQRLEAPSD
jgi:hypothetical protein